MDHGQSDRLVAQAAVFELATPLLIDHRGEAVALDGFYVDTDPLGDLVDIVAEFFAQLGHDPGEARPDAI